MPYRAPAPRSEPAARPPSDVFHLRKYGLAWLIGMSLVAVSSIVGGAALYSSTSLECTRTIPAATASCSFVEQGVLGRRTSNLPPNPASVHVQDALLYDDGARPTLGIHPDGMAIQWFQLGTRNVEIESAFAAFVLSTEPGHMAFLLDRRVSIALLIPIVGLAMLAMILLLETDQVVRIWEDSGRVVVVRRKVWGAAGEKEYHLDDIDEVTTRQEGEDSELYWVELRANGKTHGLCVGNDDAIRRIHQRLDGVREQRKRSRQAEDNR